MWWHANHSVKDVEGKVHQKVELKHKKTEEQACLGRTGSFLSHQPSSLQAALTSRMSTRNSSYKSGNDAWTEETSEISEVPDVMATTASQRKARSKESHPPRTRLFKLWQATTWAAPSTCHSSRNTSKAASPQLSLGRPGTCSTDPSRVSTAGSVSQGSHLQPGLLNVDQRGSIVRSLTSSLSVAPQKGQEMGEEDDMVSILPPQDWLYLQDGAQCYHSFHPTKVKKQDIQYVEKFLDACRRKYTTLILCWRWLIDYEGCGRVTFQSFSKSARDVMGFKEPKRLWAYLNTRKTSFLTLDEWDPISFRQLFEFKSICMGEYGGLDVAFNFGMDRTGSRTCTMAELIQFCDDHDYSGDEKALFESLDMRQKQFITLDDLEFLVRWEGQKHAHFENQFDFHLARINKKRKAKAEQKAKIEALGSISRRHLWDGVALPSVADEVLVDDFPDPS